MTYMIAGGETFNMVLCHQDDSDPSTWDDKDLLSDLRECYKGWDPK